MDCVSGKPLQIFKYKEEDDKPQYNIRKDSNGVLSGRDYYDYFDQHRMDVLCDLGIGWYRENAIICMNWYHL